MAFLLLEVTIYSFIHSEGSSQHVLLCVCFFLFQSTVATSQFLVASISLIIPTGSDLKAVFLCIRAKQKIRLQLFPETCKSQVKLSSRSFLHGKAKQRTFHQNRSQIKQTTFFLSPCQQHLSSTDDISQHLRLQMYTDDLCQHSHSFLSCFKRNGCCSRASILIFIRFGKTARPLYHHATHQNTRGVQVKIAHKTIARQLPDSLV